MKVSMVIEFKDGATNLDIAAGLRFQAGLLEGMRPKDAASRKNTDTVKHEAEEDDEAEEVVPAKKAKAGKKAPAKAASFDDDDEAEEGEDNEEPTEDEEDFAPAKKLTKAKAPKYTSEDVNDACRARAEKKGGKEGRTEVLTILKKKFNVAKVGELDENQYAAVIAAMKG